MRLPGMRRSSSHTGVHSQSDGYPDLRGQRSGDPRRGSVGRPPQQPGSMRPSVARGNRNRPLPRLCAHGMATVGSPHNHSPSRPSPRALEKAKEVICIGQWSVRKFQEPGNGLIYVNTKTGHSTTTPPREVLFALDLDLDSQRGTDSATEDVASQDMNELLVSEAPKSPRFRRIVLGSSHDMPLRMARDLLDVVREDASLFVELQHRYSEFPSESILSLGDLSEAIKDTTLQLEPGDISDVMGTDDGMQILLRVR